MHRGKFLMTTECQDLGR